MSPDELTRFHAGEDTVFTNLVATHSPRLLGVAARLTSDRARAHDLVHDAWVLAYARRHTFAGTGSFVGWMLTVIRSCAHQAFRTESRHATRASGYARETPLAHDPSESLDASLDSTAVSAKLLDALAQLTERQRDVVVMRIIESRSVAETARMLGIAEGTVKATLAQALQRMRTTLPETTP